MSVELRDGERLLKLKDASWDAPQHDKDQDVTVVRLWQLLSGGQSLRDTTLGERRQL